MNLTEHLARQAAWSLQTFGPGARTFGLLSHIRSELDEISAQPDDLYEWIDVVILAFDGAWRAGYTPEQIAEALAAKQAKNETRTWPNWQDYNQDTAINHMKDPE